MSTNKFTSRGFGSSGAASSSWTGPRESYKPQSVDHGTSFLMGGGGLKSRPRSSASTDSFVDTKVTGNSLDSKEVDRDEKKRPALLNRGSIVTGASVFRAGDRSSNFSEQYGVFLTITVIALAIAFAIRWFASESEDTDWVEERRSVVRYHQGR